ncbi:aspartyl protease family protein [Catalinimonas niigatensis]|uniref:aspartyl protease family protein n=1 Tax=Catalinimonas niigatensis TaxID=1397264 RepID=UPI002666166B|nr:aspartyl protease family protein [Catalinimonas niigatensis]WPP50807.1 aspartyl protease family protein [Catalinimonas niigatensis]
MRMHSIFVLILLYTSTLSTRAQTVNYEYINMVHLDHKPIVAAKINGKTAYFLIDTGSDISILDEKNTKLFKFRIAHSKEESHNIEGINGIKKNLSRIKFCRLVLGNSEMKSTLFALDLSKLVSLVKKKSHITIHGIIGSDIMRKYDFMIDYNTRRIGFSTKHAIEEKSHERHFSQYSLKSKGIEEMISHYY